MTDSTSLIRIVWNAQPEEIYNLAVQSHPQALFETAEYKADDAASGRSTFHKSLCPSRGGDNGGALVTYRVMPIEPLTGYNYIHVKTGIGPDLAAPGVDHLVEEADAKKCDVLCKLGRIPMKQRNIFGSGVHLSGRA